VIGAGGYVYVNNPGLTILPQSVASPARESAREASALENRGGLSPLVPTDTSVATGSSVELAVRAADERGGPRGDVFVRFAIDEGAGTLLTEEARTDSAGIARTSLLMPTHPIEVVVHAALDDADAPVMRFTIVGREDVSAQMEYVRGDGQEADAGTVLPLPYGVEIVDTEGRPAPDVEVRFQVISGGGSASPAVARTDARGRASAMWRLGPGPGFQTLSATSPAVETPVTFTAIARPPGASVGAEQPEQVEGVPGMVAGPIPAPGMRPANRSTPRAGSGSVVVAAQNFVVGGSSVCVLAEGRVTCRGADSRGQGIVGGIPGSQALAAGLFHVCALDASGAASCWGANEAGQLGDGTRVDKDAPTPVATDLRFSTLSAGVAHTCGLTHGGRAACWGQNLGGQLGDGSREDRATPGRADTPSFDLLAAGWNHTCAVTGSGVAYCWGLNREGQVGDGSRLDRLEPRQITTSVMALAAGSAHTCAIAEGQVLCWGENRSGQLGDGTTEARPSPTPVTGLTGTPTAIVAGAAHSCVLLADGTALCWGQNLHGQLGNGSTTNATTPRPVAGALAFERLAAGGAVTCGVTRGGAEYCWGLNQAGQIGDGTLANRAAPTRVGADP
jgi:hypothetical protein